MIDVRRVDRIAAIAVLAVATVLAVRVGAWYNVDGIVYLDLSDAALQGDWATFVNAYWSPLYPLLIAGARHLIGTDRAVETSVVAALNVGIAALAALGYTQLLHELDERGWAPRSSTTILAARVAAWSAFATVVLRISPVTLPTPDLLVVGIQIWAAAMLLHAARAEAPGRTALLSGAVLGLGYLVKGAMVVIGGAFGIAFFLLVAPRPRRRLVWAMSLGGTLVVAPWCLLLSRHEGALTLGSVASLNLAWYVGEQSSQYPDPDAIVADTLPNRFDHDDAVPAVYRFTPHLVGTYPPWTDPTWWHRGITPQPTWHGERSVLAVGTAMVWSVMVLPLLALALAGTPPGVGDPTIGRALAMLSTIALAQLLLYWPVHFETRFLAVPWLFAWLAIIGTVARADRSLPRGVRAVPAIVLLGAVLAIPPGLASYLSLAVAAVIAAAVVVIARRRREPVLMAWAPLIALALVPVLTMIPSRIRAGASPIERRDRTTATTLRAAGVADGDLVASIDATSPAGWARLGRWRVSGEVARSRATQFWRSSPAEQARVLGALQRSGARAVVAVLKPGVAPPPSWQTVPGSTVLIRVLGVPPQ